MTTPTTRIKPTSDAHGDGWIVEIIHADKYVGALRTDTRAQARELARQIRSGELTQY